jgi:alpha-galactosidase
MIDCWMANKRSRSGDLVPDRKRFPSGMKGLGEILHSMGFLFGIYESAGYITCQGLPGSLGTSPSYQLCNNSGYEEQDAKLFTLWSTSLVLS